MIRVMIADDHAVVRRGLIQILSAEPDMQIVVEANSGDEVLTHIRSDEWDVAILDIAMPSKNILELIKLAKLNNPAKPILILSMYPEEEYALRMIRAGADGYLTKESAPEQLVLVIRKLIKGHKYISAELSEILLNNVLDDKANLHDSLTDREFQVFIALAKGKRLTEIATDMALSIKTISTYRTRLLDKLHLKNNADIIHYAIEYKLED
jgi:DNA-binding NarL/FixJ family response regulator